MGAAALLGVRARGDRRLTRVARDRREGFWKGFAVMRDLQGRAASSASSFRGLRADRPQLAGPPGDRRRQLRSGRDCAADRGGGDRVASRGSESRRGRRGGHPRGERRCRDRCRRRSADGHRRPRCRLLRLLGAGRSPSAVLRGAAACNRSRPENDRRRTSAPRGPATSKRGGSRSPVASVRAIPDDSTGIRPPPNGGCPHIEPANPSRAPPGCYGDWVIGQVQTPGKIVPALAVVAVLHPPRSQHTDQQRSNTCLQEQ